MCRISCGMMALITSGPPGIKPMGGVYAGKAVWLSLPEAWFKQNSEPEEKKRRFRRFRYHGVDRETIEKKQICEELRQLGVRFGITEKSLWEKTFPGWIGLKVADRTELLRASALRLTMMAAPKGRFELAAVYTDGRINRSTAAVIAALCTIARTVTVWPRVSDGLLSACYGVADLYVDTANKAEFHFLLQRPPAWFAPLPGAVVLSLCGDFPVLPEGSFTDAIFVPPEKYLLHGFEPSELAAALNACGFLRPEQFTVERLCKKRLIN